MKNIFVFYLQCEVKDLMKHLGIDFGLLTETERPKIVKLEIDESDQPEITETDRSEMGQPDSKRRKLSPDFEGTSSNTVERYKVEKTKQNSCSICGYTSRKNKQRVSHQINIHFEKSVIERYEIDFKRLKCSICGEDMSGKSKLIRHLAMNHGVLKESGLKIWNNGSSPDKTPEHPSFSCALCCKNYTDQVGKVFQNN